MSPAPSPRERDQAHAIIPRRMILSAGGVLGLEALAGCGTSTPARATPPAAPPTPTSIPWNKLASATHGRLLRPSSPDYAVARLTENPRFDSARPLGVLQVANTSDIQTAVRFAREHDVPLAVRSGGHSYAGVSSGGSPRALVIDLRGLNRVQVRDATAVLGSGVSLAVAYARLAAQNVAIPGGSCPTVGLGGLTLGGGVGVLTRPFGLTCDGLASVEMVNVDGTLVTASATENPELFWAMRGGGGRLGVVTSFTMKTHPAPTIRTFYRRWSADTAHEVIGAWQNWITGSDRKLWSTLKVLGGTTHPDGPSLMVSGTWIGSANSHPLPALLRACPPPLGAADSVLSYGQAMASYAGCSTIATDRCHTGPGGALEREPLAATSHIASVALPDAGVSAIVDAIGKTPPRLKEAGVSIDALGGAVDDIEAADTAWAHRGALFTVQYTATVTDPARIGGAQTWARHLRSTTTPWWGHDAYVNYIDPTVPSSAYFGAHLPRLRAIKTDLDPDGIFGPSW